MLRVLLAALLALAASGCSCSLEDANERAAEGASRQDSGAAREALAAFGEAGDCVFDDAEDDELARTLLAAVFYRLHLLGGPEAVARDGGEKCAWAVRALRESGHESYLDYSFHLLLSLEDASFDAEDVPPWQSLDRFLVLTDTLLARVDRMPSEMPPEVYVEAPRELLGAFARLAGLEAARGFAVQAWRRALAANLPPERARERLVKVYRGMSEAWEAMAAAPGISAQTREEFGAERLRAVAWGERVALLINPDDLDHEVPREMLLLSCPGHLKDGRTRAMAALQEKQSGNRRRALGYLIEALAHFEFAVVIGVEEGAVKRSMQQYMEEVLMTLWDLARQ
ncbi:MAG: hypothetical protein HYY18_19560 [Planctomycetes bacterium]|nr:hypothetical protein [Planctomycetota bacterium]